MAFNLDEILSSINKSGLQKSSHVSCIITPPSSLSDDGVFRDLEFRVNSVNFPGFSLGTDEYRHMGVGLNEKRPISAGFEDISITIIADGQGKIHNKLHDWFELIYPTDPDSEDAEHFEYPENYYGGLTLLMYDSTGKVHTEYSFRHPFPTSLGSVQMSWDSTDNIIMIPLTFTYRTYNKQSITN